MAFLKFDAQKCSLCRLCTTKCPFDALRIEREGIVVNQNCRMCGVCVKLCPEKALRFEQQENSADKSTWNDFLIFVEQERGEIHGVAIELIGEAKKLAAKVGYKVNCVIVGGAGTLANAQKLLTYGVDKVYAYEHPELEGFRADCYTSVVANCIAAIRPSSVLIGATALGRSLAPRLSTRFHTGLTADCTELDIKPNTDMVQIRPAFGGNIMAQIAISRSRPQFATVRYRVMDRAKKVEKPTGEVIPCAVTEEMLTSNIRVVSSQVIEKVKSIDEEDVLVVAGRGVRNEKDVEMCRALERLGQQQQKYDLTYQGKYETFLSDLNNLFHVFQYDESVDINRYSLFLSISEQAELDAAKLLLAASCMPWEDGTEVPREHTPNYILLDTDDSTSPAPEYVIESYDSGSFLYHSSDRRNPIAAIPNETITELRKLADPDQTSRVVMGISILGSGNNQYTLNDPVSIAQLAQLLVNDPDTVALNRHPSYDMTDWLTNWTTRCFVEYGIKVLSRDRTEGWYIQASTAGGSSYFIDVPEHLVEPMKAVCERLDNYLTYDIPFNFAQYVHYAPSANSNILVSEIPRDTVLAIDELLGGAVLSDGTESLSVTDADGILDFRLPTEKEKLFFFLQEDGDRCLASAVRKIESGAMEHPVTHILPAGTSEVLRGIVDTQATTDTPTKVKYTIENRALITQLSQLFLNDPETVARNESPDYDMADWLTNWTNAYVIYYGTEYCPAGYEEGWYARAVDAGSWYFIQIPDHLVNEILSICRKNEA